MRKEMAENLRKALWIRAKERFGTIQQFAEALGVTRQTATSIMHGSDLSQQRILGICEILGIAKSDIPVYFFPDDVKIVKTRQM